VAKVKNKDKKQAKKEVASGKQEVATTAANPKHVEKRKKEVAEKKKKPATEKLEDNNATVSSAVGVAKPKPELRQKGISSDNLPEHATKRRIKLASTLTPETIEVTLSEITGTSTTMYVNDIHDTVPVVLEQVYWVHTPGGRWPLGRVSKEDYEFIHSSAKGKLADDRHLVVVTDCAVNPTLSYAWKLADLKGKPLPTLDMVLKLDKEFKNNPTYIHNRNPQFVVRENEELELDEDEDDFILDDHDLITEDEDDGEDDWGEDEDFTDD